MVMVMRVRQGDGHTVMSFRQGDGPGHGHESQVG